MLILPRFDINRSAIPANALILSSYKTTNPSLLRRRSPTILAKSRSDYSSKKGPEIVEPCFIHEDAQVDPSAKIGPNVSIGQGVKIGAGCRVKESILLENTVLDVSCSSISFCRKAMLTIQCRVI
jgi:mannose-1-phosphate guanylyltransferase